MRADPLAPVVAIVVTVTVVVGVAIELVHGFTHAEPVEVLVSLFSLSEEQNVPTWVATCLLFSCAVAVAQVAADVSRRGAPMQRHWWGLSALFFYISFDEFAELHENLNGVAGGAVYFDWIIPAAAGVLLLGILYLPFLRSLPAATRRRFLVAAALYVGGALVMELPLGWQADRAGEQNLGYALIDAFEETLELAGAGTFLLAVRAHAAAGGAP